LTAGLTPGSEFHGENGGGGYFLDSLIKTCMSAEASVRLIEEMLDLKIQQYAESQLRPTPEVARILHEKRETDRRRLEQIRMELARVLIR